MLENYKSYILYLLIGGTVQASTLILKFNLIFTVEPKDGQLKLILFRNIPV
jgi:hypothetical protein